MKLHTSWLFSATCTIIIAVSTYATTTQAARQIQAEVKLQQVTADSPSRSLKYGDKTTKKIPNQEVLFLPTSSSTEKTENYLPATEKQTLSRNRSRLRVDHHEIEKNQANVQISRRSDTVSEQNQLHGEHQIQQIQNNRALINKPTVGQQRTQISSRPRTASVLKQNQQLQLQPTQYSNSNIESDKSIAKTNAITTTKTSHKSRQRATTTTTTVSSTNAYQIPLSSHNSNVRTHHPTANNSTIVRHYHSNQRNRNNSNINSSNSQPLATSNSVAASGLLTKTETSSNHAKYTGPRPTFQFPNSLNIFTAEFWQFLNPSSSPISKLQEITPSTTTTRKPPKKYKPQTQISTKEEKLSLVKQKPVILPRTTTKQPEFRVKANNSNFSKNDEGPFRIALPTLNIPSPKKDTNRDHEKGKRNVEKEKVNLRERFDCPRESEVRFQLFPKICKIDEDCKQWNREEICCEIFGANSCVSGIPKPLEETSHAPILGVIPRKCPSRPLAELWWEVKECETDMDCWPRVCCPDGRRRYCRTSQPELNTVPVPVQRSFNYLSEYLECTPPPPAIFDLHPKPCTSTLDCFPNVCCQEAGQRHCRPPKKSVLTMLANVFNVDFVKRLTQNIVIK